MWAYACQVLLQRLLLTASTTAAVLVLTAGTAIAFEPDPAALVMNARGTVVSVADTREIGRAHV